MKLLMFISYVVDQAFKMPSRLLLYWPRIKLWDLLCWVEYLPCNDCPALLLFQPIGGLWLFPFIKLFYCLFLDVYIPECIINLHEIVTFNMGIHQFANSLIADDLIRRQKLNTGENLLCSTNMRSKCNF